VIRLAALLLSGFAACGRDSPAPAAPAAPASPAAKTDPSKWNLLLVSFDTTRADALGCYGNSHGASPNVDALAKEGTLFTHAFTPVPITLPAHTTMLTGLDPSRHSVRDNALYDVPASAPLLQQTLKGEGRRTFAVVASIVLLARHRLSRGFDSYDDRGLVVTGGEEHERQADAVAAAALPQLAGSEPFFGFVHFYDPHQPWRAPQDLVAKTGDPYLAEVANADRALGRLIDALRNSGRLDRTIVVVTADHGEGRGEHGEMSHGMLLHDATQHVPLVVRVPGAKPSRCDDLVRLCDLAPTLLELLRVAVPTGLDGRSLAAAFRGGELDDEDAYLETISTQLAFDLAPLFGVRTKEWKLVVGSRPHLWHLADDPGETKEVAADHADVVAALMRKLSHLRDGRGPVLERDLRAVTGDELKVLGGIGYVSTGSADLAADASGLPDPYDHVSIGDDLAKAGLLVDARRFDEAIAIYSKLVQQLPGCYAAHEAFGVACGKKGDSARALEQLLAAAAIHPGSPDLQIQIALAAHFCGKDDLVASHLALAIARPHCPPLAYFMLWELKNGGGDAEGARRILEELLKRSDLAPGDRAQAEQLLRRKG
jgi:arylsulfatase A-like enzyme